MRRGAVIGIALMALPYFAFANVSSALAQAGSTGGTIGKQDKSISGGESVVEPHAPVKSRPKSQRPIETPESSEVSVAGRWRWTQDCPPRWQGEFDLAETSRGHFNGSFAGTSWYDNGTITDGHISGTSVSFTRKSAPVTQYWTGRLTAGRMKGTSSGNANCSWEATRK
jgi:hypothetical protein